MACLFWWTDMQNTHIFLPGLLLTLWILHLFSFKRTHTHTHAFACPVICSCPFVSTEGRWALLKSLMARLWHLLWTPGWTKGHIYFWPNVENGAPEIIDFPSFYLFFYPCLLCFCSLSFVWFSSSPSSPCSPLFAPASPTWLFAGGWRRPTCVWGYIDTLHNLWKQSCDLGQHQCTSGKMQSAG